MPKAIMGQDARMLINQSKIILSFYLCLLSVASVSQEKGVLEVLVSGAKPNHGQVILSIFNSEDNYLNTPVVGMIEKVNASGKVTFHLPGLSTGDYAISAFYDEDENGELNTGFLGIPTELVGFSNNVKGSFGPPSFNQVKIEFTDNKKISINLNSANE